MSTAEEILIQRGMKIISIEPETTIVDALKIMLKNRIGAVLVKKGDEYVGIWTERDLMRNTIAEDFDPKTAKIKNFMVRDLKTAEHTDEIFQLEDKFPGMNIRHLLIERGNRIIGLLSVRDIIQASLHEKDEELKRVNAIANWEDFENWQWVSRNYFLLKFSCSGTTFYKKKWCRKLLIVFVFLFIFKIPTCRNEPFFNTAFFVICGLSVG